VVTSVPFDGVYAVIGCVAACIILALAIRELFRRE
jgi:hypothetical protein